MNRLLRIAGREYAAYVRTIGFWLSICLMPVGLLAAIAAPILMAKSAPTPIVAILDMTQGGYGARLAQALGRTGPEGRPLARIVPSPVRTDSLAGAAAALRPFLSGDLSLPGGGRLDAAVILRPDVGGAAADVWSRNAADHTIEGRVATALSDLLRRERLAKAGIDPKTLQAIDEMAPRVTAYSPKAEHGKVGDREQLQGFIGFGMGILLWMVVLTGAGILLNSVIEEKSSRILEVLLSSASVPEIMGGKILGVAGVTATVLGVWLSIGAVILLKVQSGLAGDLVATLFSKGLLIYFAFYFVGGYLMYATLFVTVGAFCETTREAQTLLGPMMILLSVPMVFMSQAMIHPDAPLLLILSWIPPFTPFLMAARAASDPPLWQVLGTGVLMLITTGLELMVAGRAFRAGALSTARFEPKLFFAGLMGGGE
ncbi:MAG: ABC transporter permease [Caulobacteraceae bacterium]|nr:ABC transporter permease [Caulobacteraceae bacterium]